MYSDMLKDFIKMSLVERYIEALEKDIFLNRKEDRPPTCSYIEVASFFKDNKIEDINEVLIEMVRINHEKLKKDIRFSRRALIQMFGMNQDIYKIIDLNNYSSSSYNMIEFCLDDNLLSTISTSVINSGILREEVQFLLKPKKEDISSLGIVEFFSKNHFTFNNNSVLNNNSHLKIDCGWVWQHANYLEEGAYREIIMNVQKEEGALTINISDIVQDYDGLASNDVFFTKDFSRSDNSIEECVNTLKDTARLISLKSSSPENWENYKAGLISNGFKEE